MDGFSIFALSKVQCFVWIVKLWPFNYGSLLFYEPAFWPYVDCRTRAVLLPFKQFLLCWTISAINCIILAVVRNTIDNLFPCKCMEKTHINKKTSYVATRTYFAGVEKPVITNGGIRTVWIIVRRFIGKRKRSHDLTRPITDCFD